MRVGGLLGLGLGALAVDALKLCLRPRDRLLALGLFAVGFGGVVADDKALGRVTVTDHDLLDAQVVAHGLIAALARERRRGVGAVVAHALTGDPVPARAREVAQVLIGAEAAVDDRHHPAQAPTPQAVLDL